MKRTRQQLKREDYNIFAGGKHHAGKYNKNSIFKWLNNGFMENLVSFVEKAGKTEILEVGCGEGQLLGVLYDKGYDVSGCDFDEESVEMTRDNFARIGYVGTVATYGNLYDLTPADERVKGRMLICCEVLEHVPDPDRGIEIIARCSDEYFIVSVPQEPIWRILNMARGKYLKGFGNTPGHRNHWGKRSFIKFVSKYAEVVAVGTPLPWIMILARRKDMQMENRNQ